ncbi:hypothetical protein [Massilia sp.]|uniref:hypothetical protein n=1 Tax=Massilia sp. TaxID=1882437 RepID=UPI00289C3129|nr:hypothetical protein [Massilia sp.]
MSEYFLKRSALSWPFKLTITPEQFEELNCAVQLQLEALYIEQKYDFVVENYLEFEETILQCGLKYMILDNQDRLSINVETALFNRRIMNFLTAYKTYDDTYRQHINRMFNRDRDVLRAAKKPFSEEYDSRVGYWMVPKIRNFVQHQGFPMHGSAYGSRWCKNFEGKDRNRYTVDLHIDPIELSEGKFNLDIRDRLAKMIPKLDLKFLIRDFMEGFSTAHHKNRELVNGRLEWALEYVQSAIDSFLSVSAYESHLGLVAFAPDGRRVSVATYANDQRLYLVRKNRKLTRLSDRYISSEIESDEVEP